VTKKKSAIDKLVLLSLWVVIATLPLTRFRIPLLIEEGLKPVWIAGTLFISTVFASNFSRNDGLDKVSVYSGLSLVMLGVVSYVSIDKTSIASTQNYITQLTRLSWMMAFFVALSSASLRENEINRSLKIWILTAVVCSSITLYEAIAANSGLPEFTSTKGLGGYVRPGVIIEPVRFCEYLIPAVVMLFVFNSVEDKEAAHNLTFGATGNRLALIVILFAYLATFSLGGILTLCVFVVAHILFISKEKDEKTCKLITYIVSSLLMLGSTIYVVSGKNIIYGTYIRILTVVNQVTGLGHIPDSDFATTSYGVRTETFEAAYKTFLDNPIIGGGLNNIGGPTGELVVGVASGFIQILGELGLLGITLFLTVTGVTIYRLSKARPLFQKNASSYAIVTAMSAVLFARLIFLVIQGNWINVKTWFDFGISVLIIRSLRT